MNRPSLQPASRWLVFASLVVLLLTLSACTTEMDLTLLKGQAWEMKVSMTIPTEMFDSIGGEAAMKEQLDNAVAEAKAQGADVRWHAEKAGENMRKYVMEGKGKGYDSLLSDAFTIEEVKHKGANAIRVEFGPDILSAGEAASAEVTIHGGRVLETDGDEQGAGTVHWADATSGGYAIVTPKGGSALWVLWVFLALAVVAVAGVAAWLVLRGRGGHQVAAPAGGNAAPAAAPASASASVSCPHCGAAGQSSGRFCMQCGQRVG